MDPLSDVLALLHVEADPPARLEAGGDWALRFDSRELVKFGFVAEGWCWVSSGGDLRRISAGDAYLLTGSEGYVLSSDPGQKAEDGNARWQRAARAGGLRIGADPDTVLVGGALRMDEHHARLLVDVMPPLISVRDSARRAPDLWAAMRLLTSELGESRPGHALAVEHLATLVFVQALRAWVAEGNGVAPGWLGALADPRIGPVLRLIHDEPERAFTVPELAATAGLSRSAFAARFKTLVGTTPLHYAQRWRMTRAAEALRVPGATVTSVGFDFGYDSHSAFSTAFKRAMGMAPRHYVQRRAGKAKA